MAERLRTFVEYIVTSKSIPAGAAIVHEVEDRDIKKLKFPPNAYEFYFFDSPTTSRDPYDAQNDQRNASKFYLIAARVISSEEARRLRKKPRAPRGKNAKKPVAFGKTKAELSESFWQVSLNQHQKFIVTRQGRILPVRLDNIVVNERGEQLHPEPFSPALKDDIPVMKMPNIRPRK